MSDVMRDAEIARLSYQRERIGEQIEALGGASGEMGQSARKPNEWMLSQEDPVKCGCEEWPECTHSLYWYQGFKAGSGAMAEKAAQHQLLAVAKARLDEATNWHTFSKDHDADEWCCKRESELRDEVMALEMAGAEPRNNHTDVQRASAGEDG